MQPSFTSAASVEGAGEKQAGASLKQAGESRLAASVDQS